MEKPLHILVFRFSSLGDVALSVPVILTVLNQNPGVSIDYVTPKFMHDLFPEHPRLMFIDFDKKSKHKGVFGLLNLLQSLDLKKYDVIVDLHEVLRTKVLATASILKGKKVVSINKDRKSRKELIEGTSITPLKHTTEKYADTFRKLGLKVDLSHELQNILFKSSKKSENIGVAPFARHKGKMYPIAKLKNVVEEISQQHPIIIFADKVELNSILDWKEIKNVTFCSGKNLKEELQIMSELRLMITMDSANMHLASLVGIPVISIWGVTHPNAGFLGYGQKMNSVIQDEDCDWRPTSIYGNKLGPEDNPTGFKSISPDQIIQKVNEILR